MVRVTKIKSFGTSHEAVYLDRLNWTENATPSFFSLVFFHFFLLFPNQLLVWQNNNLLGKAETIRDAIRTFNSPPSIAEK